MLRERETEGRGEVEYIELDRSLWPPEEEVLAQAQEAQSDFIAPPAADQAMREDFEEAQMPAPFEYPFDD